MLHDVGHVPMLDDPSGLAHLVRDFIMRAGGADALARPPRASQEKHAIPAAAQMQGSP